MVKYPNQAFILAAGFGTRMRPLTNDCPKPLLPVNGKPILRHTLDKLEQAPIEKVVINGHYLKSQMSQFVEDYTGDLIVLFSEEEEALETGGGVVRAGQFLDLKQDLFCVLGDSLWEGENIFTHLVENWQPEKMDFLLSLFPIDRMLNPTKKGDFQRAKNGALSWGDDVPYMYMGVCLIKGGIFEGLEERSFSMKDLWQKSMDDGRLFGVEYPGQWYHLSTPRDIKMVEDACDR